MSDVSDQFACMSASASASRITCDGSIAPLLPRFPGFQGIGRTSFLRSGFLRTGASLARLLWFGLACEGKYGMGVPAHQHVSSHLRFYLLVRRRYLVRAERSVRTV